MSHRPTETPLVARTPVLGAAPSRLLRAGVLLCCLLLGGAAYAQVSGEVWVSDWFDCNIDVLDAESLVLIETITSVNCPVEMALAERSDGTERLFVHEWDTNSILVTNASPDQLETVEALIKIYDKPPSEDSIWRRTPGNR